MGLGLKALCRYILTTWLTAALALLTLDSATVASPAGASLVVIYLFIFAGASFWAGLEKGAQQRLATCSHVLLEPNNSS